MLNRKSVNDARRRLKFVNLKKEFFSLFSVQKVFSLKS